LFVEIKQVTSYDIQLNIGVSICYMNYHIICLKCPPLAETHVCSRLVVFHSAVSGSLVLSRLNQLWCIFKLSNWL